MPREIEIVPSSIPQATNNARIRVNAQRLQPHHRVVFNGTEVQTHFVSKTEVVAKIPAKMIKDVGIYDLAIVSPGEFNARSTSAHLIVTFRNNKERLNRSKTKSGNR